jgi:hypothetical protein
MTHRPKTRVINTTRPVGAMTMASIKAGLRASIKAGANPAKPGIVTMTTAVIVVTAALRRVAPPHAMLGHALPLRLVAV